MLLRARFLHPQDLAIQETVLEAADASTLQREWDGRRGSLLTVEPVATSPAGRQTKFDVAGWCREVATLLRAGMTVVEAVETLLEQDHEPQRARVHAGLLGALRQGLPLSRAMRETAVFPDVLVASVVAAERTSTLASSLEDYLRYADMMGRLRKQLVSAAIYPAVVVALGLLIAGFLLLFVMPRFAQMYSDLRTGVSTTTQLLLGLSQGLQAHSTLVLGAAIGVLVVTALSARRLPWGLIGDRLIEAIGPLDRQWERFRLAKLYQALMLLFKGGYTFDEALAMSVGLGLGAPMTRRIETARAELAQGQSVALVFARHGLCDGVTQRLLAVGERTGAFSNVLEVVASRYAELFGTFIERATRLLEPLLLLLVALGVGGIVVLMYMPVFDVATGLR